MKTKILDWLNERKEFCIGAAEQALNSRSKCQTGNVVGFPQINQLEQLFKEIK